MIIERIELSPEAAGTLAALVESPHISLYSGREFRMGAHGDAHYQELVRAGFVEEFHIIGRVSRYELLRDVELPTVEFSSCRPAQIYSVILTDDQREQLAMEHQNDRERSHAIAGAPYQPIQFDGRCLGNYE